MPILRRHGWPGVLGLALGNMNEPGASITPAQVRRLIDAGWESPTDSAGLDERRAVAALKAAGYRRAMPVAPGLASARQRFELRHIRMADEMRIQGLAGQLEALGAR